MAENFLKQFNIIKELCNRVEIRKMPELSFVYDAQV